MSAWDEALPDAGEVEWEAWGPVLPTTCPQCGGALQNDPPDPDVGLFSGIVYCEGLGNDPDCQWNVGY